jgi:hypothetical protein
LLEHEIRKLESRVKRVKGIESPEDLNDLKIEINMLIWGYQIKGLRKFCDSENCITRNWNIKLEKLEQNAIIRDECICIWMI